LAKQLICGFVCTKIRFMQNQAYNCQRCGSENTSSFPMIYQGGTQTGNFQAVSYGFGVGAIGTAGKTKNQNLLSQQTAPPSKPSLNREDFVFACILGICITPILWFLLESLDRYVEESVYVFTFLIIFSVYYYFRYQQVEKKRIAWKEEMREWENCWMCMKCGNVWFALLGK
jgi:hypothetical protein